jgi:hypothetical protein
MKKKPWSRKRLPQLAEDLARRGEGPGRATARQAQGDRVDFAALLDVEADLARAGEASIATESAVDVTAAITPVGAV